MSFLLPVLRQSLRHSNLRHRAGLTVTRNAFRIYPAIALAKYSQNHGTQPPSSQSQSDKPSNAINDPLEDPLAPGSSSAPNTETNKDPLSGDVQAAPGSILSQYTPQESRDLDTRGSESALPKRDEYVSSADRKRDQMARIFTWGFLLGLVGGGVYLGRPLEPEEQERVGWGDVFPFEPPSC